MNFTPKQKEILEMAKAKGFVTIESFYSVFSSPISRKANYERFLASGILVKTETDGKFKLNPEKLKELDGRGN
jgi:phage portal protein BeeE